MSSSPFERLDAQLLDRFLAGDAMPDEVARVERALARSAALRDAVAELRRKPLFASSVERRPDVRRGRTLLEQRLDERPLRLGRRSLPQGMHSLYPWSWHRRSRWIGWSACAAVVILAGVTLYGRKRVASPSATSRTYATRSGMLATVELADGSRITLAPRTTLTIRSTFGRVAHHVSLMGEAHFEIAPNAHTPFTVQTGRVTTRVLGTTFNVRRYPGDSAGQVVVLSGKVATKSASTLPVTLSAGMIAWFTDSVVTATAVVPGTYTDWSQGQLVFRDESVPVVLATLKRWYGYDFRLADSALATWHISAEFPIGDTSKMLQFVRHLLGVNLTFDDSVVTLHVPRDANAPTGAPRDRTRIRIHTSPISTEVGR